MTDHPQPPTAVTVKPTDNGPYRIAGPIVLQDAAGNRWDLPEGRAAFLCRCGHSGNKPFCDGTHAKIGFESAVRAPQPVG